MKFTREQAQEILPALRKAVQSKIECWDAQGEIEGVLGHMFKDMEYCGIEDFAVGEPEDITVEDALEYINSLEVDGE